MENLKFNKLKQFLSPSVHTYHSRKAAKPTTIIIIEEFPMFLRFHAYIYKPYININRQIKKKKNIIVHPYTSTLTGGVSVGAALLASTFFTLISSTFSADSAWDSEDDFPLVVDAVPFESPLTFASVCKENISNL